MPREWVSSKGRKWVPSAHVGRALTQAGYARYLVRRQVAYSGYITNWDNVGQKTYLTWRPGDDVRDEVVAEERLAMVSLYEDVLKAAGYAVERTDSALYVPPKS